MPCPRRSEPFAPHATDPAKDRIDEHGVCIYCGGLSGDEIMRRIEAGEEIGATDKSYKIYLGGGYKKGYLQHLSEAQMIRFVELFNAGKIKFEGNVPFYVLPFFMRRAGEKPVEGV